MRNIFNKILLEKAKKNKKIFLLTADLGYNSFEKIKLNLNDRFINCGIAENNMIGIATGLALKGKKVFVYSIIPFLIHRSIEHIKNNICIPNLDIKLIGAGGGFSYAEQGVSHNPTEDIAIVNTLPNVKIFSPSNSIEAEKSINYIMKSKGPAYIRLGKVPENNFNNKKSFSVLNPNILVKGKKIIIISTGNILQNIYKANKILEKNNIYPTILSCCTLKPFPSNDINKLIKDYKYIFTIEEHSNIGGLGSMINNALINNLKQNQKIVNISLQDKPHIDIGSQEYLRKINNIDDLSIAKKIIKYVKK